MEKDFYRTNEVAELLGITYQAVFSLRRRAGVMPIHIKGVFGNWYAKEQVATMREVQEKPWLAVDTHKETVLP